MTRAQTTALEARKARLEAERNEVIHGLPHLYGAKLYAWADNFIKSTNRINLLCAANQISKSSTQQRKFIRWATDKKLWPKLWDHTPRQFWYLYPSADVATTEFYEKIEPEWLPRGRFKDDPVFGWEAEFEKGHIKAIHFKSGVSIYFKTYMQHPKTLQSGSCDAIFCDEELPEHLYSEIKARLFGTNGYFHMVFTATLNELMWYQAIEGKGESELFPHAFKQQISMYDCMVYADGTPSKWTEERIKECEADCKSKNEVLRRIHGRFVADTGRKYEFFDPTVHFIKPRPIPRGWTVYGAIDKGGGKKTSKNNHYSATCFIAVNPDMTLGYIFNGQRFDGQELTSQDLLDKFKEQERDNRIACTMKIYPHDAKDFGLIAERQGYPFLKADKSHERGEDVINTLFKANMLLLFDTPELRKLGTELMTLMKSTVKDNAKDDFADAMRYGVVSIPWDYQHAAKVIADAERQNGEADEEDGGSVRVYTEQELREEEIRRRRGEYNQEEKRDSIQDEIDEWNDLYGT